MDPCVRRENLTLSCHERRRSAYGGDGEGDDGGGRERLMKAKEGKGNRKGLVRGTWNLGLYTYTLMEG
jgi:hypothetical protein